VAVNLDKPQRWKQDIVASVDLYNEWFLRFAPKTYRGERKKSTKHVEAMLQRTNYLRNLSAKELRNHPSILFALRMSTAPPIARDRLVGLADVSKNLVNNMELKHRLPPQMRPASLEKNLSKIAEMILRLADVDIFRWLEENRGPKQGEV